MRNSRAGGGLHTGSPTRHDVIKQQRGDETFLCIHEYHSGERGRRTKTTEVNDFSVSSSALLRSLRPLVVVGFKTRNTRSGGRITAVTGNMFLLVMFL